METALQLWVRELRNRAGERSELAWNMFWDNDTVGTSSSDSRMAYVHDSGRFWVRVANTWELLCQAWWVE